MIVIAGPNGAGKTTCASVLLVDHLHVPRFVNADVVAADFANEGLEPSEIQAGRRMLGELAELAALRVDFAFEATLASRALPTVPA